MRYSYEATDLKGKVSRGIREAENPEQLKKILKVERLILKTFKEQRGSSGIKRPKRLGKPEIVNFTRELGVMIESGLSLTAALNIQERMQRKGILKNLIIELRDNIISGNSFFSGFLRYENSFGPTYINLIKVGEISGTLGKTLEELSNLLEKNEEIRKKVRGAMVYPTTVMIITIMITGGLIVFVLPAFTSMFTETGVKLPFITQFLLDISRFLRTQWYSALGGAIVGSVILKNILKTKKGKVIKNRILYRLPLLGNLVRESVALRFTRTLGTLLEGGVSVVRSLEISSQSIGDPYFEDKIAEVTAEVQSGERIATSLQKTGFFDVATISMISVGEESGELVEMLRKIADYSERHLNYIIRDALTLIEPIMVVFLGMVVGSIILAMYLPMFEMINIVDK